MQVKNFRCTIMHYKINCMKSSMNGGLFVFRLSNIKNETFSSFPELSRLNLAGNRLTTTFRKEFFANNQYLNDIWLGDNPWRYECNKKSLEFYKFLTSRPPRVNSITSLNNILQMLFSIDLWELYALVERCVAVSMLCTGQSKWCALGKCMRE